MIILDYYISLVKIWHKALLKCPSERTPAPLDAILRLNPGVHTLNVTLIQAPPEIPVIYLDEAESAEAESAEAERQRHIAYARARIEEFTNPEQVAAAERRLNDALNSDERWDRVNRGGIPRSAASLPELPASALAQLNGDPFDFEDDSVGHRMNSETQDIIAYIFWMIIILIIVWIIHSELR